MITLTINYILYFIDKLFHTNLLCTLYCPTALFAIINTMNDSFCGTSKNNSVMRGSRGGWQGVQIPQKNQLGFPCNIGPDQASIKCWAFHRHASETPSKLAFRLLGDDGRFIVVFGSSLPSPTKKTLSMTKFSGTAHVSRVTTMYHYLIMNHLSLINVDISKYFKPSLCLLHYNDITGVFYLA